MMKTCIKFYFLFILLPVSCPFLLIAQNNYKSRFEKSTLYAGIDIGSKGIKLSILDIGKNALKSGAFKLVKDTAINTDFISFSEPTFRSTLLAMCRLYDIATKTYKIADDRVFTVVSSGIGIQAKKEEKADWIYNLIDSFKIRINKPGQKVPIIDVNNEARLSHLGIVPEERRYNTFLIDIGSGNTKGGYFPNGNTNNFKLFQLSWGTKSIANATEKRLEADNSISNYNRQLFRVLEGAEHSDIIYAINESGAYPMTDYIAFSGGIAWSVATLVSPELAESPVVTVTFSDVQRLNEKLLNNFKSLSDSLLLRSVKDNSLDRNYIAGEIRKVHQVFDQKALLAGTGLLLKVMRQFVSIYEEKKFYLVKTGQVGWISAYVFANQLAGK